MKGQHVCNLRCARGWRRTEPNFTERLLVFKKVSQIIEYLRVEPTTKHEQIKPCHFRAISETLAHKHVWFCIPVVLLMGFTVV